MPRYRLTTPWYSDGVYYAADVHNPIVLEVPEGTKPARFWVPTNAPVTHSTVPIPDDAQSYAEIGAATTARPQTGMLAPDPMAQTPSPLTPAPAQVAEGASAAPGELSQFDQ